MIVHTLAEVCCLAILRIEAGRVLVPSRCKESVGLRWISVEVGEIGGRKLSRQVVMLRNGFFNVKLAVLEGVVCVLHLIMKSVRSELIAILLITEFFL